MYITRIISFLFLIIVLAGHPLAAQFFVMDKAPCPHGSDVQIDTIFYSPDKAMPFDRCFYLKYTLPGTPQINHFAITPVDRRGNPKVRRRDYRVFYKSLYHDKEIRDSVKKDHPYWKFRQMKMFRLFSDIKVVSKGKNTEVTLNVPPLDPGREYEIVLIKTSTNSAQALVEVGKLIFKSQYPTNRPEFIDQAKRQYHQHASQRNNQKIPFSRRRKNQTESFAEFKDYVSSFILQFNQDTSQVMKVDSTLKRRYIKNDPMKIIEYRVFFTPLNEIFSDSIKASHLGYTQYLNKIDYTNYSKKYLGLDPEKLLIATLIRDPTNKTDTIVAQLKDTYGKPVIFDQDGGYQIHLLTLKYDSLELRKAITPKKIDQFLKLGELKITQKGTKYTFTAANSIIDRDSIIIKSDPIGRYRRIHEAAKKIDLSVTVPFPHFYTPALQYLINKAAIDPSKEKGMKDLTQKDDLLRTLSVLFQQQNQVLKNIQLGIISLVNLTTLADSSDHSTRLGNVKTSIDQLNNLTEFGHKIRAVRGTDTLHLDNLLITIGDFSKNLDTTAINLKIIGKEEDELKGAYISRFILWETLPRTSGSTTVLNFASEGKLRIVPDFGFIGVLKGGHSMGFQDLTPYLGFHINFRSIDKDIPLRMVRYKTWRHRLSFMSGITLRSLKIENQRDDFFGSSSLITGLGFRLNNYLKVISGIVWFKAVDTNPLSTDRPLRVSPFIGLSLDLEIQDLFGGIKKLFTL